MSTSNSTTLVCGLIAIVISFFLNIYISAPIMRDIYEMFILPETKFVLSNAAFLGISYLYSLFLAGLYINQPSKEDKNPLASVSVLYIFQVIIWGFANLTHWFIS